MDDFITYYKGEDLHPSIEGVFDWAQKHCFKFLGTQQDKAILAGGALRSYFSKTPIRDFDVYFRSMQGHIEAANQIGQNLYLGWKEVSQTKDSTVWEQTRIQAREGVQRTVLNLIRNKFADVPDDIINTYDFTVCMCGMTSEQIVFHPEYWIDLQTKVLRLNNIEDPLNTLWRVQKYNKYGFEMDKDEMWRLVELIHSMASLPKVDLNIDKPTGDAIPVERVFSGS